MGGAKPLVTFGLWHPMQLFAKGENESGTVPWSDLELSLETQEVYWGGRLPLPGIL